MTSLPNIVVLTGAGISAESGLKTFRDSGGLWENFPIEDVATPEAFSTNPDLVYEFYNLRRRQLKQQTVQPNLAHLALAELEGYLGDNFTLITQNVDDLHERAGSQRVLHMHGTLRSARCLTSGKAIPWENDFDAQTLCQCCTPKSAMRPDIVWFGELPMHMDEIYQKLSHADVFISVGTSGQVYPAAGLVELANNVGADTIELNLEAGDQHTNFNQSIYGKASQVVPQFVHTLLTSLKDK
ncbi:NAD-dependent protein deacylase [Alteromonas ponticola]|uniref:NAD-dependent protein deacylase n=1 Tax=Alteromonas aquimaris TaxID=2998417 RepID=A0ABT3P6J0_9ALTE|nr:Sir2 family NAD+-dependent deacetylase [Alteromonas aquimaris]MCW8108387.1 NAD-dependent protein deacylase [Alteromonas aquimaris]